MYVSKIDIDTLSELRSMIQNAIEGGAEDEEYWFGLQERTSHLFEKAIKAHHTKKFNRKYKRK